MFKAIASFLAGIFVVYAAYQGNIYYVTRAEPELFRALAGLGGALGCAFLAVLISRIDMVINLLSDASIRPGRRGVDPVDFAPPAPPKVRGRK
jgi:hypothetical protein